MAIHHDKPAYGKLYSLHENLTGEKLAEMAKKLSSYADKDFKQDHVIENACEEEGEEKISRRKKLIRN